MTFIEEEKIGNLNPREDLFFKLKKLTKKIILHVLKRKFIRSHLAGFVDKK